MAALFQTLDLDKDGFLSRSDLDNYARRFGWSWQEAPFFAVFDLLSISRPIPESEFIDLIHQACSDPLGPYGNMLLKSPHFIKPEFLSDTRNYTQTTTGEEPRKESLKKDHHAQPDSDSFSRLLERTAGNKAAFKYQSLLETLEVVRIQTGEAAVLIIDPQRSFTDGAWMHSLGHSGEMEATPIRLAFDNCVTFLARYYGHMEIMFTRCPFPAGSYGWADRLSGILNQNQLYFIKPGNSVLFPPTNGFNQWVSDGIDHGITTLVMGGCTLNSCVRVSSTETSRKFGNRNLQVVVDLSLSGARASNYIAAPEFNGLSSVESAIAQMRDEGIHVVRWVEWV